MASFEEKSVWVQLVGMLVAAGAYFVAAARMMSNGTPPLIAFVPLFVVSVVVMVAVLAAGHIVVAATGRTNERDERDRLIGWRAESNACWVVATGVLAAITGLVLSIHPVWVAHLLLMSLFLSEILKYVLQLVYYRRGV